jgi:hypothetical protein
MDTDDETRILETLRCETEKLLASADPLMRSQYQHLYGRITAVIAERACAADLAGPN